MFSERTWFIRGFEESMADFYLNQRFMEELLDGLMTVCLHTLETLLQPFGDRIDAVGMTEDAGSEHSMILGPELWRKMLKPGLGRICGRIKKAVKTLPFGTPQEVIREIDRCLEKMAIGVRYILAPAKPMLFGVPVANAVALIDRFVNQNGRRR